LSWHGTEPGKDEGNMQLPTMADARMDYTAPIEPKDAGAIVALSHQRQKREPGRRSSRCSRRKAPTDDAPWARSLN
jgi:hypothetical protein